MAIVLKEADENPNLWKKEVTCDGNGWDQNGKIPCRRLLLVDERDIRYHDYTDYAGKKERYYGIVCPKCGCFSQINVDDIPMNVRIQAPEYLEDSDID